mmetsp:Transcript_2855/g.6180  ORF Transcript_2855/g.6180 Transcript_2855/m.6180 type:complete len:98 (+) Transcript_2855:645-938(+)
MIPSIVMGMSGVTSLPECASTTDTSSEDATKYQILAQIMMHQCVVAMASHTRMSAPRQLPASMSGMKAHAWILLIPSHPMKNRNLLESNNKIRYFFV